MNTTPVVTEQRRIATALYSGPNSQLTGLAALHWYGFTHAPSTHLVHALVPHNIRRRSTGFVVVQRAMSLDPGFRDVELFRVVSPARAVVDACRSLSSLRDARAVMAEAVQSEHATLHAIDSEIRRAGRSRTALARRVQAEIIDGIRSAPEGDLRELTATSKVLPRLLWNPTLLRPDGTVLMRPDGYLPDVALALEVDSRAHHTKFGDWSRTLERHNLLEEYGGSSLHFTPVSIRRKGQQVLETIERTYLFRLASSTRSTILVRETYP